MKWNIPKNGEFRTITRFLFFPCKLKDEVRWLEVATIEQRFFRTLAACNLQGGYWFNWRWADNPKEKE